MSDPRQTIWRDCENLIETFNTKAHVIAFCSENYKSTGYFASKKKGARQIDWLGSSSWWGRAMDMQRQIAQALETVANNWTHSMGTSDLNDAPILFRYSPPKNNISDVLGDTMFGESPKRKILCLCGAIAEIDSKIAGTKKRLSKCVECRSCRNERIAQEMEELRSHFTGEDVENG